LPSAMTAAARAMPDDSVGESVEMSAGSFKRQ
jgi:hypothetical protein